MNVKPILSNSSSRSNNIDSISNSDNNNITSQSINASSLAINNNNERNLGDDTIYHVIDYDDAQEWHKKDYPSPEFQHGINSDDETEVASSMNYAINNDEDTFYAERCLLTPPID